MATFVATLKFTQQGITNAQETTKRAAAFKAAARKMGCKITSQFWMLGRFDGLVIFEAPDEEAATALMLNLGSLGYVETQTARAFTAAEMDGILQKAGK